MVLKRETDLYEPIKLFFEKMGYTVQAEVKNCDIACIFENKLILIELKKAFSLKIIYQAMDRKVFSDFVYIGLPRPKNFRKREVKNMIKILTLLEIGLITVAIDSPIKTVEVILEPKPKANGSKSKRRNNVLKEIENRNLNINLGGSSKKNKILTSYKENVIYITCFLEKFKKAKGAEIKKLTGIENATYILRCNHFGYFKKIERGIYALSEEGINMLARGDFKEAIDYYKEEVKKFV